MDLKNAKSNAAPKVSVIIPTYNRWSILIKSLSFLQNQSFRDFEVIVVDDASEEKAPKLKFDVRYFRLKTRSGSPAARNFGATYARGRYLLFLDDDIFLSSNYLEELVPILEADENVAAIAGRLVYVKGGVFAISRKVFDVPVRVVKFSGDVLGSFGRKTAGLVEVPTLHVAAVVKRGDFQFAGGFDSETYAGNYFREETDLFFRLTRTGKKLLFDPNAVAYHVKVGTGGQRFNILKYEYYVLRNHFRLLRKFFGRKSIIMTFFFFFRRIYERLKQLYGYILRKAGLTKVNRFNLER